jgi:hypothetical protein
MEAHQMVIAAEPAASLRAWGQVAAAIELVAQGHYPRVAVSGIPNARRIAAVFEPDAERCGVEIVLEPVGDSESPGIVVRRR